MVERRWMVRQAVILLAMLSAVACSRRAPGPTECVWFAEMHFGHHFETLAPYPAEKAAFDQLVATCLTLPFDRRVFACAEQSHAPMACLRRIQPELSENRQINAVLRRDWQHEAL
jgi:hypothetical protein